CSPVPPRTDIIPQPVVVFEIQSDSTGHIDRVAKNAEYRATPSIQHYVMLEQTSMAATVFSREGQNWVGRLLVGETPLALPAIGIELPLATLYEGVTLAQQDS
ncbi:MAG: Uma2 family endonuclease, partial [Acetobacteraceae bacterium]